MSSSVRFTSILLLALGLISAAATSEAATAQAADTSVFELRTYTAMPGKIDAVLARFRDHTCKLFEKHGMVNVGYWVPLDEKDGAGKKLIYLLQHKSREAAAASWKAFGADPVWVAARTASEANGKIVEKAESVFLSTTDFSPALESVAKSAGAPRVFEMRTYSAAEGKLPALNARFRNYTLTRFVQHGMTNVIYLHPLDADKGAGKTLVYFMAYPNRDAATKAWADFRADPIWVKAKSDSEKEGSLTTKVESVFLAPTDFSTLK